VQKQQFKELFTSLHPQFIQSGGELPDGTDDVLFTPEEKEKRQASKKRKLLDGTDVSQNTYPPDDDEAHSLREELLAQKERVGFLEQQVADLTAALQNERAEHDKTREKFENLRNKISLLTND